MYSFFLQWILILVLGLIPLGSLRWIAGQTLTAGLAHASEPSEMRSFPPNTWVVLKPNGDRATERSDGLPGFRAWHQASYDLEFKEVVIFGGSAGTYMSDTWTYSLSENKWTRRRAHPDLEGPCRRDMHNLVYDPVHKLHWLFNGIPYHNLQPECPVPKSRAGVWAYDRSKNVWTKYPDTPGLHHRLAPGLAYNSKKGTILEFGGGSERVNNTTYEFDPAAKGWTLLSVSGPKPPGRFNIEGGLVYHKAANKFVLFGGLTSMRGARLNDTWIFDPDTVQWRQANPPVSPPGRDIHTMVYDESTEAIVLVGGRAGPGEERGVLNDTWVYDIKKDTWTELTNVGNLPRLVHASAVYDPFQRVNIIVTGRHTLVFRYQPSNTQ